MDEFARVLEGSPRIPALAPLRGEGTDDTEARGVRMRRVQGDADSGLLYMYPLVRERWPTSRWVYVARDFAEAWESLKLFAAGGPWHAKINTSPGARAVAEQLWASAERGLVRDPLCVTVPFDQLDKLTVLARLWHFLQLPGEFDFERAELLQTMRIEPHQHKHEMGDCRKLADSIKTEAAVGAILGAES